ncbi:hypothetical protein BJV82DRAFT_583717 [Fennellomyces sp. T-0311]|nr:hypothetical protein BJV82DRAFT_583717 [Fennellomyces sp. T-0311]
MSNHQHQQNNDWLSARNHDSHALRDRPPQSDAHHHHREQHVDTASADFPSPREASGPSKPTASGVGDLLNTNKQPSIKTSSPEANARSYAFVSDFPSPQEASKPSEGPKSMGVSDLLEEDHDKVVRKDPTVPPHPERSFANVAGNKDFPALQPSPSHSATSGESLSSIPDVKDMLGTPTMKVKPPPPSQSFARIAAKASAHEEQKPSERTIALEKQNDALANQPEDPSDITHENFPTLAQANQMAEQGANADRDRAMFTEISKIGGAADAAAGVEDKTPSATDNEKESFANITGRNLDQAPPSASTRAVPRHPQYDEETIMKESARREARKWKQDNSDEQVTPEQVLLENRKEEVEEQKAAEMTVVAERIEHFDKHRRGKFNMLDTFKALRDLGYSFITAIPVTLLMHVRLSPLTSPHRFPFLYRSLSDIISLPIYTDRLAPALAYGAPLLTGRIGGQVVERYGRQQHGTNTVGLTFWDGVRAIGQIERLRFWQLNSWFVHRLQWILMYTVLQDPQSHLVTAKALTGLPTVSRIQ